MAKNRIVGFGRRVACRQRFHRSTQVAASPFTSSMAGHVAGYVFSPDRRLGPARNPGGYLLLALVPRVQIVTPMSFHFALLFASNQKFRLSNISQHTTGRFESKPVHLTRPSNQPETPPPLIVLCLRFSSIRLCSVDWRRPD